MFILLQLLSVGCDCAVNALDLLTVRCVSICVCVGCLLYCVLGGSLISGFGL